MRNVADVAKEIVAREGGFVDDPDDPGGATKHGVTLHTLRRLSMDMNGDARIDLSDLHDITESDAVQIFLQHYFDAPGIFKLPDSLQASVFDMYVNSGVNAVRILQKLLRQMGHDVAVDGKIGPQTTFAAKNAEIAAPKHLADAYGIARRNYYFSLADVRPQSRKYARTRTGAKGGWIKRAEGFVSDRFHMTDREFQERTATWG